LCWVKDDDRYLVVINFRPESVHVLVHVWRDDLVDLFDLNTTCDSAGEG
jgi:hypothetical protein